MRHSSSSRFSAAQQLVEGRPAREREAQGRVALALALAQPDQEVVLARGAVRGSAPKAASMPSNGVRPASCAVLAQRARQLGAQLEREPRAQLVGCGGRAREVGSSRAGGRPASFSLQ